MKDIITINEASQLWGIAPTRIAKLCREGRIEGARKEKRHGLFLQMLGALLMDVSSQEHI